jgi:hypothetical protein
MLFVGCFLTKSRRNHRTWETFNYHRKTVACQNSSFVSAYTILYILYDILNPRICSHVIPYGSGVDPVRVLGSGPSLKFG